MSSVHHSADLVSLGECHGSPLVKTYEQEPTMGVINYLPPLLEQLHGATVHVHDLVEKSKHKTIFNRVNLP